jgi:thiamine biosynthesis protein ThiI
MVPFMELHTALLDYIPEAYNITIMRRMMYRIAEKIALKNNDIILLNGESIGQVASQTLKSMSVINEVVNMPVVRPLSTYDKIDIIKLSKKIDCYNISIKPFEDCCTVYVPKKPTTAPKLNRCIYYESKYDFDALVDKTVENTKVIMISAKDDLDITMLGLVVSEVI